MLARIRKALIAGVGAGLAAGFGAVATAGALTQEEVSRALGVGVAAAVTVGWTAWKVPNVKASASAGSSATAE